MACCTQGLPCSSLVLPPPFLQAWPPSTFVFLEILPPTSKPYPPRFCMSSHLFANLTPMHLVFVGVTDRVWDGCGFQKEHGKESGSRSEELWSRREADRTWLQLVRCALVHTVSYFRKPIRQKRKQGGTKVNIQTGDTGGNI